jgi:predicted metalloprotease with PDZ domain
LFTLEGWPSAGIHPMLQKHFFIVLLFLTNSALQAQNALHDPADAIESRFSSRQPVIHYTLRVDTGNLSMIEVEMQLRDTPDTFQVAMFAHPEYDDRYWRFNENLRAESRNGQASIIRKDSALWRIVAPGGEVTIHYFIHLPAYKGRRAAWRPFLSPTGGLIGGPQSFMFVVGAALAPAHVTLQIPAGWEIATGLEPTADPHNFYAPSASVLMDAPILIGYFRNWDFTVDAVPHKVAYWPSPHAANFDTATLINDIQRIVQQTSSFFGRLPYREYFFLLQDSAYGALEHCNSVILGLPSEDLAKDVTSYLGEIAHEYFHTWNLMRIRPAEYGDINYKAPPPSRGLWWSEGLTMFYADLFLRRAHLRVYDSTRIKHLENLVGRYVEDPGNLKISPEMVSMSSNTPPGLLGDYTASTHLQGELLGEMLDLIIRDATNGENSIDDLMRRMFEQFGGKKGFTGKDIEQLTTTLCKCNVHSFFEEHIRGNKPLDFNRYLALLGMHVDVLWKDAVDAGGKPLADLRIYAWQSPDKKEVKLLVTDPAGCWGKAGLHTGDRVTTINGELIKSTEDFRYRMGKFQINEVVNFEIIRATGKYKTTVTVSGYKQPLASIAEIKHVSAKQRRLQNSWLAGE